MPVIRYSYNQPSVPSCSASSLWSFRTLVTAVASSCSSFRRVLFGSASTLWRRFCRNWYSRWSSRCSFSRHEYRVSWYCLSGSWNQSTKHLLNWTAPVNMCVDKTVTILTLDNSFKFRPFYWRESSSIICVTFYLLSLNLHTASHPTTQRPTASLWRDGVTRTVTAMAYVVLS